MIHKQPQQQPSHPSHRLRTARAAFGLPPNPTTTTTNNNNSKPRRHEAKAAWTALAIDIALKPAQTALVTGPSGSGKSTILNRLLNASAATTITLPHDQTLLRTTSPIIELIDRPLNQAISLLARAGIADAALFHLTPAQLSEGQRHRLRLAIAIDALKRAYHRSDTRFGPPTLVADEFASTLDRPTAHTLARAAARWIASTTYARLVVATAHDDLIEPLAPAMLIHVPLARAPTII